MYKCVFHTYLSPTYFISFELLNIFFSIYNFKLIIILFTILFKITIQFEQDILIEKKKYE
jgi:hypothetical protein